MNGPAEYLTPAELSVVVDIDAGEYAQYLYDASSIQANCSTYVQADGSTDHLGGAYFSLPTSSCQRCPLAFLPSHCWPRAVSADLKGTMGSCSCKRRRAPGHDSSFHSGGRGRKPHGFSDQFSPHGLQQSAVVAEVSDRSDLELYGTLSVCVVFLHGRMQCAARQRTCIGVADAKNRQHNACRAD